MDQVKLSKLLSLVLRHKPEEIGLTLDSHGWANVQELLKCLKTVSMTELRAVVVENNKQRFSFDETETRIRANQGHSIVVDLDLKEQIPPPILYHGTGMKYINSIMKMGIEKRNRQHVHLSKDVDTAINVGSRHGKPVVITIKSGEMHKDGCKFFLSENGVWLTDKVDPKYFDHVDYK